MIKQFEKVSDYEAAAKSTTESTVSLVESTNETHLDGVNVVVSPIASQVGDAVFLDEKNEIKMISGTSIQKALIPAGWTHVGFVFLRRGRLVGVIDKTGEDMKYLDVCQYAITAISSTAVTIKLRMSPDYAVDTAVSVTLSSTAINATTAGEISAAVAAKAAEVGDTKAWWAYLADSEGNKVSEGGTQIIVQCDECVDYRFYNVSATGCTISHISWGDMPASDVYLKNDGGRTNYWGVMNVARTRAWATSNGRIPTAMEPVKKTGNDAPVRPSCFETEGADGYEYCELLRQKFGTYERYLREGLGVKYPQKYGTFALPSDVELTAKYGPMMAPTKAGGTKAKYPALHRGYETHYSNAQLAQGCWVLPGSEKGCYLMDDATLAKLATPISRMGTTAINNGTSRWCAERYGVYGARMFNGYHGNLDYHNVANRPRVQPVALLKF